ncbi:DNA replication ATP-dependent helicase/nuclease DNA2 [Wickerhamiella sorbophila]|uniref:DNA replication ATP-dependent helicase/nuclease n=1 Tax=Wickerhamiella sorbophila TaxID=45607 RepID=A0A2T0FH74_9ASCO|nr:DNA replication ATP-dependent helicase/nuclease DNA2 [Wickerhamiella sorbophila]PRT54330.1 DNA replication ATP-dependent helicase/nuclease DNA2 [Wickerhamiella sorbophila]
MDPKAAIVNWESSSPPRPKPMALDVSCDQTPLRGSGPKYAPSSENSNANDPVDDLLGKYQINPLRSSPPPTWPIPLAKPAQKFFSESSSSNPLTAAAMRLYSPGYLKRPRSIGPLTPLKPRKTVSAKFVLDDDDDDSNFSFLGKENIPPLSDDDDLDFGALLAQKAPTPPEDSVKYPNLPEPVLAYKESPLEIHPTPSQCHRFVVEVVGIEADHTVLVCKGLKGTVTIEVRDTWRQIQFETNDVVHILGDINGSENIVVSHATQLILVLNPDTLLACTAVAESFNCERQIVLRNRLRTPSDSNVAMIYGVIIHELIQVCLLENSFSIPFMEEKLENDIIDRFVEDLMVLELEPKFALEEIKERLPQIVKWAATALCPGRPLFKAPIHRSSKELTVKISRTLVIEEEIWSPRYGLKGKIDAVVAASTGGPEFTSALEIKTGSMSGFSSSAHRAQVMLYSLLLKERYEKILPWMLLYYAQEAAMIAVRPMIDEIRGLILRRNMLVRHINRPARLPWHTSSSFDCKYCVRKDDCTVFTAANAEHKAEDNPGIKIAENLMEQATKWSSNQLAFFRHWDRLLVYEDIETNRLTRDIWCMDAETREATGKCLANIQISLRSYKKESIKSTYVYIGTRSVPLPDIDQTGFNYFSPIVVSSSKNVAEATGSIYKLNSEEVEFVANHELDQSETYRLDLEDHQHFLSVSKYNLLRMFVERPRLLELVVDLKAPIFDTSVKVPISPGLNDDQTGALRKVMQTKDYTLILGMPGTGKTTTIVSIVQALLAQGKSVFISANTHSAVDNIVLKLMNLNIDLLRVGYATRVNPQVQRFMAAREAKLDPNLEPSARLEQLYLNVPVVAATCLTINSWLFSRRHFDYCIIDEASQITLPTCLGPLRHADRFVLVGDHFQLQPIVHSAVARQNGLGESLFKRLCDAHPSAVVNLSHQYRMNGDIMNLSSTLIYNGMLKCGSEAVKNARLSLPKQIHFSPNWIKPVLDSNNSVVFLNTDEVGAPEEERTDGVANPKESKIILDIITYFVDHGGIQQSDIGVISVYRAQLRLIKERLSKYKELDVLTADQAQGRDKNCIVISLVRSNNDKRVGDLLRDWRRINVCFTRAKSKLVIVGSRRTLTYAPTLEKFLKIIETNGWMWNA